MSVTKRLARTIPYAAALAVLGGALLAARPLAGGADAAVPEREAPAPEREAPAPPVRPVPADEDCMRCHEDMRPELERPVPHEPALDEECVLCHDPHAARYEHLLNRRERALCFTCHRDQSIAFMKGASLHAPIREGRCTACHEPHGSVHEGLLKGTGNELCLSCHETQAAQASQRTVHEPFVEGECSDCHAAHNSEHDDLLVAPATALCQLCHAPEDDELVEAHAGIPVVGSRCTSCHASHASPQGSLLLASAHEPFASGDCDMCHLVDSDTPRLLMATGGRLCQACHRDYQLTDKPVVHKPVAEGDCGACHEPHASPHAGLLSLAPRQACLSCHAEIEERARTARSVHSDKVEGGSCTICHLPHSSEEEKLLTAGEIRTCIGCHETQRHGHPLGEDRLDPRTGKPITCVTCHDTHGTAYPMQLRGDQTRGLCLECHAADSDGGRRRRDGRR